jgi:hypothetical protein
VQTFLGYTQPKAKCVALATTTHTRNGGRLFHFEIFSVLRVAIVTIYNTPNFELSEPLMKKCLDKSISLVFFSTTRNLCVNEEI